MAGFRALAQQVRDPGRDPSQRRQALRKCLERFAPYGHRATWQHLCANAGVHPDDREPDPARLVSALEELEEARDVWLAYESEVAARRRREKRDGIRQPTELDEWHSLTWGGRSLLPCDPSAPPTPRLADVLRRMIAAGGTTLPLRARGDDKRPRIGLRKSVRRGTGTVLASGG